MDRTIIAKELMILMIELRGQWAKVVAVALWAMLPLFCGCNKSEPPNAPAVDAAESGKEAVPVKKEDSLPKLPDMHQ